MTEHGSQEPVLEHSGGKMAVIVMLIVAGVIALALIIMLIGTGSEGANRADPPSTTVGG